MLVCKIIVNTKIPENNSLSSNGGDYYEGFTIKGYKKNRKSRPRFTYNEWSSCEILEGTFPVYQISHKEVKEILSKYVGNFSTIIKSLRYFEVMITDC